MATSLTFLLLTVSDETLKLWTWNRCWEILSRHTQC